MQALCGHDVGLHQAQKRLQHRAGRAHGVGCGGETDRHTFQGVSLDLPVQRLMLAELLEQDHRQQAGPGPASGDHVERRRRLADLLTVAAAELLPHGLDHLPGSWNHLQGLGHVLAQFAQARAAAAAARARRGDHHPLARQMLREGGSLGRPLACEARHGGGLGHRRLGGDLIGRGAGLGFLEGQLQLIGQPCRTFRLLAVDLALQLGDAQLLMGDQRQVFGSHGLGDSQLRRDRVPVREDLPLADPRRQQRCLQRLDIVGKGLEIGVHIQEGIIKRDA